MTADDRLALATRALREVADRPSTIDGAATRSRVLLAATKHRRRRWVGRSILPFAAMLVFSSAWASTHGMGPRAWQRVSQLWRSVGGNARVSVNTAHPEPREIAISTAEPVAPPDEPATVVGMVSVEELPRAAPVVVLARPSRPATAIVPIPASADQSPDAASDRELALYGAAHQAHFVDHDPAAALRAWDAYLEAEPRGRFALDAEYNRALALVRLARYRDASRALEPFATGARGSYRASDARKLREKIDQMQ